MSNRLAAAGTAGGVRSAKRSGPRYVYGSRPDPTDVHPDEARMLNAHHSHFIMVDNGAIGTSAYGSESARPWASRGTHASSMASRSPRMLIC